MNYITHTDLWWVALITDHFQKWVLDELWEEETQSATCGPLDSPVDRDIPP